MLRKGHVPEMDDKLAESYLPRLRRVTSDHIDHSPSKFKQNRLHCELSFPLRETGQSRWVDLNQVTWLLPDGKMHTVVLNDGYLSRARINAGKIYLGNKLNQWRHIRVVVTTVNIHAVNAVFMYALDARNGSVEEKIKRALIYNEHEEALEWYRSSFSS